MRRQLIEALSYPKLLILKIIDERDCPHDSEFEATSRQCNDCELSRECHWVSCLNDFAEFDGKATHTINASLRYGIHLVESMHSELRHDETTCMCEACVWIRDSQRLNEAFEQRFALNRYRHLF